MNAELYFVKFKIIIFYFKNLLIMSLKTNIISKVFVTYLMKNIKSGYFAYTIQGFAAIIGGVLFILFSCKEKVTESKELQKISATEIEKDSSYLFKHQLSDQTRQALDQLNQMKMTEGNLGSQLSGFIRDGVYDYGEIFKFIELRWKGLTAELEPKSRSEIDELAKVMILFPNMRIKMECYTDNNGNPDKLLKVSQARVEFIKKEVVAAGVAPERIDIKGFGSKYPVADNKTMEGQLINNRIEIIILKLF